MTQPGSPILRAPRRLARVGSSAACAAAAFAAASSASAGGDEAIRISVDIPVAGFVHSFNGNADQTDGLIGVPAGGGFLSVYNAIIPVGVGYVFRKNLYVGGRFGFQTYFPDGGDGYFTGRLSGRFEYIFNGDKIRPFVGGDLGFTAIALPNFFGGGTSTYGGFIGAGSGGVHIFLADSFTLSPFGELAFQHYFDPGTSSVSLLFGATLAGWIWR